MLLVESFVEVTAVLFLLVASLCNSIYLLLRRTLVHFVFHSSFKKTHLIFSALNYICWFETHRRYFNVRYLSSGASCL